jgi:hypothetical protein
VWPYLNTPNVFADQTRAFFAAARAATRPDLPVALGRVGDQMLADAVIGAAGGGVDTPANRRAATRWRRSLQEALGADPGCAWWDEDGLPVLQSGGNPAFWYHHAGSGYLAAGERAYAAWQRASGETPPPPPPPPAVFFNGRSVPWSVRLNGEPAGGPGDVIDIEEAA